MPSTIDKLHRLLDLARDLGGETFAKDIENLVIAPRFYPGGFRRDMEEAWPMPAFQKAMASLREHNKLTSDELSKRYGTLHRTETWTSPAGQSFTGTPEYIVGVKAGWDAPRPVALTHLNLVGRTTITVDYVTREVRRYEERWGRLPDSILVTWRQKRLLQDEWMARYKCYPTHIAGSPLKSVAPPAEHSDCYAPTKEGDVW